MTLRILLILGGYATVIAAGEVLYRTGWNAFRTRKLIHVGSALVTAAMPWAMSSGTAVAIGLAATVLVAVFGRLGSFRSVYATGEGVGPALFPLGLTVAAAVVWPISMVAFTGAAVASGLADVVAAMVGHRWGRHQYVVTGTKSIEGSIAFLSVAVLTVVSVVALASGFSALLRALPVIAVGCVGLTLLEGALARGTDNLVLPLATAGLLALIL